MTIKIPELLGMAEALSAQYAATGFTNTFAARLGRLDGVTVIEPDRPFTGANQYVWYTANGKEHLALIGSMAGVRYTNALWGLPVIIGNPPKNLGFGPDEQAVIGLGGIDGRQSAGGNSTYDTFINNVSYVDLNHIKVLRVEPANAMVVTVSGDWAYPNLTTLALQIFTTTSFDASAGAVGLAASQHRIGLVYINPSTGAIGMLNGTLRTSASGTVPYRADFTPADLTEFDISNIIPCGVLYFNFGQDTITESDCLRNLEVRSIFYPPYLFGGGGTSGTVVHGQSTNYSALTTDIWVGVNCGGGPVTITLPQVTAALKGHVITIADEFQNADVNTIFVQPFAGDFLDNVFSFGVGRSIKIVRGKLTVMAIDVGFWVTIGSDRQNMDYSLTEDLSLGTFKIKNLQDPASAQDAATKAYVDGIAGGGSSANVFGYLFQG